ncbi:hypothetical protein [Rubritalea tangerina]|uniref:DUF2934 domain-containing protein n=1 Tax=Rubritalea tangerina TaxID=430798 RepID=A0ABW4Z6U7_9BACT
MAKKATKKTAKKAAKTAVKSAKKAAKKATKKVAAKKTTKKVAKKSAKKAETVELELVAKVAPTREAIQQAAYFNYLDRLKSGQPGSPELDWSKAEQDLA